MSGKLPEISGKLPMKKKALSRTFSVTQKWLTEFIENLVCHLGVSVTLCELTKLCGNFSEVYEYLESS